ncbi:response regulator transcription factor [Salinisphaera orenii]|uniref:Transcriptional regulator n=1 Tax=Salinisphaera orenii YIM 95161 TaxID=1051139 RepID=A0A423PLA7_9GAMM|nr:response regulator transcription factor [Salinisphaera halophila]ROO26385.1 transcriptional regulator [Salinisphaera halophila YIM 95161]
MRLLIVEDEPTLVEQLAEALAEAGYAVDVATDGEDAAYRGATEPYDAVVLDLGLPRLDGLSVLRGWRAEAVAVPVLVLTARGEWHEKVDGIDAGADDYLAKPFRMEELLARLRALIRRASGGASAVIERGGVTLDTRSARVSVAGRPIRLTGHEYRVLSYLMHHAGQVVSRSELIEHIYAQDYDRDSNTIEVFVRRLRSKLGVAAIVTERGFGYRFVDTADPVD